MKVMIEKNIDCFIDMMKRSVDTALANKNSSRYESVYKFFKVNKNKVFHLVFIALYN